MIWKRSRTFRKSRRGDGCRSTGLRAVDLCTCSTHEAACGPARPKPFIAGVLRPFEPDDMLTVKFEHAAPRDDERYAAEEDEVRKTLEQMMPEKRLSRLRRWMLPCSAPSTPSRCRRRSCRTACGSRRAGGGGEQRAAPRHRPGARERLRGG